VNPCYIAQWSLVGLFVAMLCGCSDLRSYPYDISDPPDKMPPSLIEATEIGSGMAGVWHGISVSDCSGVTLKDPGRCNAVQNITLTMFQQGDQLTGFYRCAYGTQNCRDLDEAGVIKNGKMNGHRLMMRVMLEDGAMCYFTGMSEGDHLDGGYLCMVSGLFEKGQFHTQRSY
jgi:hypothetical protein